MVPVELSLEKFASHKSRIDERESIIESEYHFTIPWLTCMQLCKNRLISRGLMEGVGDGGWGNPGKGHILRFTRKS